MLLSLVQPQCGVQSTGTWSYIVRVQVRNERLDGVFGALLTQLDDSWGLFW